jgi:putative two-component system response regulator
MPLLDWFDEVDDGGPDPILDTAATIALTHHEKWDGSGYPLGLAGEQIPLESRIVGICDVFDALTSRRPYKPPCSEDAAFGIVRDSRGRHFDPEVYSAFCRALPEIRALRMRFADGASLNTLGEDGP